MSVAKSFSEYPTSSYRNEQSRKLAERTQMLIDIANKAREESLTLQETNDLYAEFNKTYELSNNTTLVAQKHLEASLEDPEIVLDSSVNIKSTHRTSTTVEPLKTIGLDGVDESWAIKLLNESELCDKKQTNIQAPTAYKSVTQAVLCEA